ncbi:SpoIID/LytB domain-containing protein [Nannocystaceae bacterium ST9]
MALRSTPRIVLTCAALVIGFAIGCVADDDERFRGDITPIPEAWIPAPLGQAYCDITVTGVGVIDMEGDYLPHVITCENGGANLEALKAQAIAARSVAYYSMANSGSICDGQGCQVYSCGANPSALAYQAVDETSGIYINYDNVLTYAFYVAGDPNTDPPSCVGTPGVGTEGWVTYNEGKSGSAVEQTDLGWVFDVGEPGYGQNRGCMSQWGARCLENANGYGYEDILRFYYGDDIVFTQAQGPCVMDLGGDGDSSSTTTDSGSTTTTDSGSTSESSSDGWGTTDGAEDGTCTIGSLGCVCTQGGGCDPGLLCIDGFCLPEGPSESGGGSTEGESEGSGTADEIGDDGLPPGFGGDSNERGDDGCACSSDAERGFGGVAGMGLLGLLGLLRRRR